jgi:hypothetical protein
MADEIDNAGSLAPMFARASAALYANDVIATRCYKAAIPYPAEWQAYDVVLRAIVKANGQGQEALPVAPARPIGI